MSSRDRVLITGGAGFVGSHFARLATDAGREVVVLDDLSGGTPARLPSSIPLVVGDIGDRALVRRVLRYHRVGAVAHFAGKIQVGESVRDPAAYFDVNLVRTLSLLCAMREAEVQACLFSSTAAVYGTPESVPIPTPDGTCVRDYIHVQDLASAHLSALARLEAGQSVGALNLGTGRGYSVREVIDAAARVLGHPIPHAVGPRRPGDPPRLVADPSAALRELGWRAARSDLATIVEDARRSRRTAAAERSA